MELHSLPLDIWEYIVEYLPKIDLHRYILTSWETYDLVHQVHPRAWRSLSLKLTSSPQDKEIVLPIKRDEIKQNIQHRRYRCVSSLAIKGIWSGEFLHGIVDSVSYIRELILEASQYGSVTDGIRDALKKIGPNLKKLVLGYSLFVAEPDLPTVITHHCPNLEHLEMRTPLLLHGVNQPFAIPSSLPYLCPLLHTFGWVCFPNRPDYFDLSPIHHMSNLRSLTLANIVIQYNNGFYTNVVLAHPFLTSLALFFPYTSRRSHLPKDGLAPFTPLTSLRTLELHNCSHNLRALNLHHLAHLTKVSYHSSARECDFETVAQLTELPRVQALEVRFQSSLRTAQLKERFVHLEQKKYTLSNRGNLYNAFCYTISN